MGGSALQMKPRTFQLLNRGIHHRLSAAAVQSKNRIVFVAELEVVLHLARLAVGTFKLEHVVLDKGGELFLNSYHQVQIKSSSHKGLPKSLTLEVPSPCRATAD